MNAIPKSAYLAFVATTNILAFSLLAGMGWSIYQRYQEGFFPAFKQTSEQSLELVQPPQVQVDSVINQHLFGPRPDNKKADTPVSRPTQETQLKVTLLGTIASNNPDLSRVIIAVKGGAANSYAIGDLIEGTNAKVREIATGKAILERAGVLESLTLERLPLVGATPAASEKPNIVPLPNQTRLMPTSPFNQSRRFLNAPNSLRRGAVFREPLTRM